MAIVTDETVAELHLRSADRQASTPPASTMSASASRRARARRASPALETVVDGHPRGADRAARRGARPRRRRGRRPRRLRRGDRAPRHALRPGADDAACAGRFLRRRQDRHQHRPRQEPRRRSFTSRASSLPTSASSIRCRRAIFNAGYAEVAKYGLIGDAGVLRLAGVELAGGRRRLAGARTCHRRLLPGQGRDRRRRRARGGRSARSSISATPSATRSRRRPASRTG